MPKEVILCDREECEDNRLEFRWDTGSVFFTDGPLISAVILHPVIDGKELSLEACWRKPFEIVDNPPPPRKKAYELGELPEMVVTVEDETGELYVFESEVESGFKRAEDTYDGNRVAHDIWCGFHDEPYTPQTCALVAKLVIKQWLGRTRSVNS